ncbi:F-box/kelch-repeat protein At5g49000-like [Arabidopsis lyrata subsp. lyrata]|uniref:F-box/kelch-repeat protein At5g49000-like n=1 Tax=Arabidopsis lyrata subsp. lyrata TaxID=81972 RepID=UPI000A29BA90|nr:F-box/kelch-repeat protein At5g49000-like [Arabidopsis lyrata subsp. lyrata]|eukprot:XP_020875009.1 F-box/kelch-repeat protein At5g49000-like [Arabidopsis lyrata subsp. lyrata]
MLRPKKKSKSTTTEMKKQSPELTPNPSLPDDLLLTCFARVSRLYYPTLSLVSKSCRSLVTSPELYKTRSFLNHSETCLYVCLEFPPDPNQRWFTLCRKPNQTLTNIPKKKNKKSCGSHTWHEAPSMRMASHNYLAANVVDGKIYVPGGLKDFDYSKWMEVFDPKIQTWEFVLSPPTLMERDLYKRLVIEGEIYLLGESGVAYKPKEDRWRYEGNLLLVWGDSHCMVDNVLYRYCDLGGISWYDSESEIGPWMKLKGLEGLPKFARYSTVKLVEYGGKMAVFWDKNLPSSGNKSRSIWCAVISLERCNNSQEIWGKVESLDAVLTVPRYHHFVDALTATV